MADLNLVYSKSARDESENDLSIGLVSMLDYQPIPREALGEQNDSNLLIILLVNNTL